MRIIVIGCPGAGKSYFSKKLSERTGITLYHLDLLFWKPDQSHSSTEELAQKLSEIMEDARGNLKRQLRGKQVFTTTVRSFS